ncbi:uncharacterized protein [Branchiostoma lanceolatum]|uniref:uncharacterized protein n=1 Tax=Branchiostoma lanceolatum TaxID=7740 RepID=UPI003455E854
MAKKQQCPPDTLHHAIDGNCRVPGVGPPILPEGTACESDLDCKRGGMCCGYVDGGSRGCKPFQEKGEPCETPYDAGAPWKLPSMISREEVGGCCKGGLHCGKELVCIPNEDTEDGDWIPKPPVEDEKTDDNPEKIDGISEEIPSIPDASEAKPDEKDDDIENLDSTQIEELDAEDHLLK